MPNTVVVTDTGDQFGLVGGQLDAILQRSPFCAIVQRTPGGDVGARF